MEAARKRREDEKNRRQIQVNTKKLRDIEIQKKLICKGSAKYYMRNLIKSSIDNLYQRGVLKNNQPLQFTKLFEKEYFPVSEQIFNRNCKIEKVLLQNIEKEKISSKCLEHKSSVDKDKQRINKIIQEKEAALKVKNF